MIRWIVQASDPRAVGQLPIVSASAIDEGRVFIGATRAKSAGAALVDGDVVTVHAPSTAASEIELLYADDGLVAACKPAELPTIADHRSARSLASETEKKVGLAAGELHATSRLDVGVSGVVVFARGRDARMRLERARDAGSYERSYVAIARGALPDEGTWTAPIGKARDARLRAAFGRDAEPAETAFRVVARADAATLLTARPRTGRTHQIRVHAAHAGHPLHGDHAYGGERRVVDGAGRVTALSRIALHAWQVIVPMSSGHALTVRAPLPDELVALWRALGGKADDCAAFVAH